MGDRVGVRGVGGRGAEVAQTSSRRRPVSACWMPRFMRSAAKFSVPSAGALVAASIACASSARAISAAIQQPVDADALHPRRNRSPSASRRR